MNASNENGKIQSAGQPQGLRSAPGQLLRRAAPPPALHPEMPALVQPYKEFVLRGWMTLNVSFDSLGTKVLARVTELVDKSKSSVDMSAPQAKALIQEKGLWTPSTKKSSGTTPNTGANRPARSLTVDDFADGPEKVLARSKAIAKLQTSTVARGRIGSLKLMIEGADTFEKWWKVAPSESKILLFTDNKHLKAIPAPQQKQFATYVPDCPFRGPVPTPSEEDEE